MTHSHILYKINIRRVMYLNVGDKATSKKKTKKQKTRPHKRNTQDLNLRKVFQDFVPKAGAIKGKILLNLIKI